MRSSRVALRFSALTEPQRAQPKRDIVLAWREQFTLSSASHRWFARRENAYLVDGFPHFLVRPSTVQMPAHRSGLPQFLKRCTQFSQLCVISLVSWVGLRSIRESCPLAEFPKKTNFWPGQIELIGNKKPKTLGRENGCFLLLLEEYCDRCCFPLKTQLAIHW